METKNFKGQILAYYNNATAIQKLYVVTAVVFLILSILAKNALEREYFMAPSLIILLAAYFVYKRRTVGWNILYIHLVYALVFYWHNYGIEKVWAYLIIALLGGCFYLILQKDVRKEFHIHSREIVIGIIGGVLLLAIPNLFRHLFFFEVAHVVVPFSVYVLLLLFVLLFLRKIPPVTASNWNQYIEGLQGISSDSYYTSLKAKLETQNVEGVSYRRVMLKKRGMFSSKREYLRVEFEDITHDISFYPFALGTYVSSWSYYTITGGQAIIASIPFVGQWLHDKLFPMTYYIADSRAMFQLLIHEVQLQILDEIINQKGLRKIAENQRVLNTKRIFDR